MIMNTCSRLPIVLRLSVILSTVVFYRNTNVVKSVASAQILVQPLWNATDNDTTCYIEDKDAYDGSVFIQGSTHSDCHLQVVATTGIQTLIEIKTSDDINNNFFLFIKREGDLAECPNKFLAYGRQAKECSSVFLQENLTLTLQGGVGISIRGVAGNEPHPGCPEILADIQTDPKINQTSVCHNIKGYDHQIACDIKNGSICRLAFPLYCNATLGHRDVHIQCLDSEMLQQHTAMIIFPNDMSTLDLFDNNIVKIEVGAFQGWNGLQVLFLQENWLSKLHSGVFLGLHVLDTLYLHENLLVQLDLGVFHGLGHLTYLKLDSNQLVMLPVGLFQGLENLSTLHLSGNKLETLEVGVFRGLRNLTILHLDDNELVHLPVGLFEGLESLNVLYLFLNQLTTINAHIFRGLNRLTKLSLSRNRLTALPVDLFWDLESLIKLYLYGNQLSMLDRSMFRDLHNLTQLELDSNMLTTLPVGLFQQLVEIDLLSLYDNHLIRLPIGVFWGHNNLDHLYLQDNQIITLNDGVFNGLGMLRYLLLYNNNLSSLAVGIFDGLDNLYELYLDNNKLLAIEPHLFDNLGNIISLSLTENQLITLPNDVFHKLNNLEYLFLEKTQLEALSVDIFKGLFKLRYLFLFENRLARLDHDIFKDNTNITFLEMSANRLIECPNLKNLNHLEFLNLRDNVLTGIMQDTFSALHSNSELYVSQHEICACYVPPGVNCSAADKRSPYLTCDRLLSDRALVVIMWLIGINALGGNLFVLVWRHRNAQKNKVQDFLLSNLALSDSLMGIYMLLVAGADIYYGENFTMQSEHWRSGITCRIAGSLSIASSEASMFFVTLISIDRFVSIKFPYSTNKLGNQSKVVVAGMIWIFSTALGVVPSVLAGNFKFYDNSHVCIGLPLALTKTYTVDQHDIRIDDYAFYYIKKAFTTEFAGLTHGLYFSTAVFLCLNCLCYLIILGCYVEIVRTVIKSSRQSGRTREMREQITLTTKVTAIVATDFMCWFPIILMGILVQTEVINLPPSVYAWAVTFVLPLNSAINPYLYTIAEILSNRRKKEPSKKPSTHVTSTSMQPR